MTRAGEPVRVDVAGHLPDDVGDAEGEDETADERQEQPALDADPGRQPAAEVHRADGGGSSAGGTRETAPSGRRPPGGARPAGRQDRSSSRWKTATGPKSCSRSHAASSSARAIERW